MERLVSVEAQPLPGVPRFDYLDIRRPEVQELVWKHLVPSDIQHDFTKLDAMNWLAEQLKSRQSSLYGDIARGVAVRVDFTHPNVASPHLMGNGIYLRSMLRLSTSTLFAMGVSYINIQTQHLPIVRVVEAFGYEIVGQIPGIARDAQGHPALVYVASMSREKYYLEK